MEAQGAINGGDEQPRPFGRGKCGVSKKKKNCLHFSICACHPCAGAMLIFSVSFQFYRVAPPEGAGELEHHTNDSNALSCCTTACSLSVLSFTTCGLPTYAQSCDVEITLVCLPIGCA